MDNLDFLKDGPSGNATLSVTYTDNTLMHIVDLSLESIEAVSPLLALAFEGTRSGPKYYIEGTTPAAIASLLRYIHNFPRDYIPEECRDIPVSMLTHAHVYWLADIYDIPDLQKQAKASLTKECEFSCSACMPPLDLCEAINFVYQALSTRRDIIDIFSNYCVSMFLYHKLGQMQAFRNLAYEHRSFQQDLCMVNIKRGFVDDAALAIIQLPVKPYGHFIRNSFESSILRDVLYDLWSVTDDTGGQNYDIDDRLESICKNPPERERVPSALPYRQCAGRRFRQLDSSTTDAIVGTFTAGILSLPNTSVLGAHNADVIEELRTWTWTNENESSVRKMMDTHAPSSLPAVEIEPDIDGNNTYEKSTSTLQTLDGGTATRHHNSYTATGNLVIRGSKRTGGARYTPFPGKKEEPEQNPTSQPITLCSHEALVDEPLTDTSDSDDGFVHVRVDSDSEWAMV